MEWQIMKDNNLPDEEIPFLVIYGGSVYGGWRQNRTLHLEFPESEMIDISDATKWIYLEDIK